jgi:hypothetical protein
MSNDIKIWLEIDTETCPICMDPIDGDQKIIRCGGEATKNPERINHTFHDQCIDRWLQINESCPLCREIVIVIESESQPIESIKPLQDNRIPESMIPESMIPENRIPEAPLTIYHNSWNIFRIQSGISGLQFTV